MLAKQNLAHAKRTCRVGQAGVTRFAGGVLRTFARLVFGVDFGNVQRHIQLRTNSPASSFKLICYDLQAMVHMNRPDLPRPLSASRMQKRSGVGTAAVSDSQRKRKNRIR